jgi:hypothetical protein
MTSLRQIATSSLLDPTERDAVEDASYRVATTRGGVGIEEIIPHGQTTIWSRLHMALATPANTSLPSKLPSPKDLPNSAKEFDSAERDVVAARFERVYLESLLLMIQGRSADLNEWRQDLDKGIWSHEASDALAQLAVNSAAELRPEPGVGLDTSPLATLSSVLFPENRDRWGIWQAFHLALKRVLTTFINLRFTTTGRMLNGDVVRRLREIRQLYPADVKDVLLDVAPPARSSEAVREFVRNETVRWESEIETFPDRAKYYLDLTQLLFENGDLEECKGLLRTAVSNAIGYGYHKDLSIFESVEAIRNIHNSGSPRARSLISRLAPIAKWSGDFTDGDETKELLIDAARACQIVCPQVLHAMYVSLVNEEKLYLAEEIFPLIVETLDLSDPFQRALASSSIDSDSMQKLRGKAQRGESNAESVVKAVERFAEVPVKPGKSEDPTAFPNINSQEPAGLAEISPEDFSEKLNSLGSRYEKREFGLKWLRHHVRKGNAKAVYLALRGYIQEEGVYWADGNMLLELVPYAYEFEGPSIAFDLLCSAGNQLYCWSRFFTDEKWIETIWDTLQERFPDRWLDFVYRTRSFSMYGVPLRQLRSLTASRGTKFLARFGALDRAEDLAEASVRNIEDLMANLRMPAVDWFSVTKSPLDTLIARLFWISNVVRERAAVALANLLRDDSTYDLTFSKLVDTLGREDLESRAIVLLLPVLRAARAGRNIPLDRLVGAIKKPSLVSDEILKEIRLEGQRHATGAVGPGWA